jgi:hypothetical protein
MIFQKKGSKALIMAVSAVMSLMCAEVFSADAELLASSENETLSYDDNVSDGVQTVTDEVMDTASVSTCHGSVIPSYIPDTGYRDILSYSIPVKINGLHNHNLLESESKIPVPQGVYTVCVDSDHDLKCEGEVTAGVTDSLGYYILAWSDITVNPDVLDNGYIIAYSTSGLTEEFFRYPVSELGFRYSTEAEIQYDSLYLNSLSNIQTLIGRQNFNRILGMVSSTDFSVMNPEEDNVYRTIMYSFDESGLGSREIYTKDSNDLSLMVNSEYNRVASKVNDHEMDNIVSLIISNIDGSEY